MQTQTPQLPPENEEIAAELRYLESIADKTATAAQTPSSENAPAPYDPQHTHHPDDVAGGTLPTDTERAQDGDDDPATVRSYSDGEHAGQALYLETAWGDLLVSGINRFCDGPWIVTGSGYLSQRSFAVCWDTKLKVGQAS